jgi:hypothetical protein
MVTNSRPAHNRDRRRASVEKVFDDFRLEGLAPSPAARRDAEDYIDGRRTLEEIIEDVVSRHTRRNGSMSPDEPSPWAAVVGSCYTATSLARELGWSPEQVSAAVVALALLELETSDGKVLYPAFQVRGGRVVDGVGAVLEVLSTGTSSTWTWAQWLNTPVDDETGEEAPSPIEQIHAGHLDEVLRDARHTAAAWRS